MLKYFRRPLEVTTERSAAALTDVISGSCMGTSAWKVCEICAAASVCLPKELLDRCDPASSCQLSIRALSVVPPGYRFPQTCSRL